jgi:hypothetical protein
MTELQKYNRYYFQNMKAFMEDDELNGELSTEWNGQFKSLPNFRNLEKIATFSFRNVKV